MNINELHSFKLSDAIKFHKELNPKLWKNDQIDPLVKKQLLIIAEDFVEELGIDDLDVVDITISGSNAAYTYTKHSDLDLHILVNMSELHQDAIYRELFRAKKTLYNDTHDITVHGIPVELYVQDSAEPVVSLGEYSILHDKWIKVPVRRSANLDQNAAKAKFEQLKDMISLALKTKDVKRIDKAIKIIKRYRQAGLDKGGEFSPENLAFKAIRTQGGINDLYTMRDRLHSKELSIEEGYTGVKMKFLKPGELRGSFTASKLMALGFKKSQNGSWFIPQAKWDELRKTSQVYESDPLAEKLSKEFEDYDPNGKPPGPEFKPTMPAGTVKVDVSDVYDWYKLGQHVSNLKGLGKHDFGKGPPSTILSFGDEETEHRYIKDLEKTGLTTTDIDPLDPKQPKNMPRQSTDPTYNVDSYAEDLDEALDSEVDHIATAINKFAQNVGVFAELRQLPEAEYPAIELTDLYAERLGAGDGSKVMIELARMADEAGINVFVHPAQARNNEFYARFGFEKDRRYRGMMVRYPSQESEDLDESGDSKPYSRETFRNRWGDQIYMFTTDYGNNYKVNIVHTGPEIAVSFDLVQHQKDGKIKHNTDITGAGDARKVFATVIDIVKRYVGERKPTAIEFGAAEPSRIRLYSAFIKRRLASELPDYEVAEDDDGYYKLKRKTEDLDEYDKKIDETENDTKKPNTSLNFRTWKRDGVPNHSFSLVRNGKEIARGEISKDNEWDDDRGASVQDIVVDYNYRRKGIATKIYNEIERRLNYKLHPSDDVKPDGEEFWRARGNVNDLVEQRTGDIWWHGSPTGDLRGGMTGLHLGTKRAAEEALTARIGYPVTGYWDGRRQYGKTKLAGTKTLKKRGIFPTGYNINIPENDFYPSEKELPTVGNQVTVPLTARPVLSAFKLNGPMSNTPNTAYDDFKANGYMSASLKRGNSKRGFYYKNVGEDAGSISIVVPNGSFVLPITANESIAEASGYIPSKKEANDPRFKTALTVDVKPDSIQKNAKAFGSETSRAGIPPTARADGKITESLMQEWESFLLEDEQDISEGPRDPQLNHLYDDDYYYHTTSTKNIPSIRERGLIGDNDSTTFSGYDRNKKVHLSHDLDSTEYWHGMVNHAVSGSIHKPNDKTTLLRVKKSNAQTEPSNRKDEVLASHVEPQYIERYHNGEWSTLV